MIDYDNSKNLRVIRTARTEDEINEGARAGFFPLLKKVEPSPKIRSKYAVFQDPETGEISVISDLRHTRSRMPTIGFTFYYPHHFPNPFAAYLIPADLQVGEKVILEDLIEDLVGQRWGQGDVYRLASSEAEWDGEDFIIQENNSDLYDLIG
ncbi:MAG: hypothetical protein RBR82_09875 [Pseudomonas sp.]|nr:hypothetical protein [Pseudomonas sp.]